MSALFRSFFSGGFECSTHRLRSGRRLDLLAATQHDRWIMEDFRRLQTQGIHTARSGIRWHLIEPKPYSYDFSSVLPFLHTAQQTGMQVIWDLCHYGYPDDIDIFAPQFVRRFARFVRAFTQVYANETDQPAFFCPINEISFFSWAGGDAGYLNPFTYGRGFELKVQLARAAVEAIEAIWDVLPDARIVHTDPVIHIVADPERPHEHEQAEGYRWAQYQGWDLLSGRLWPQIGGDPKYLDILGLNYYPNNQWIFNGPVLKRTNARYRPFREIIQEVYDRYQRPLFIAETGTEDDERPTWLSYVVDEVLASIEAGLSVEGVCLYPIVCHPGWDDDRHCHNGLWDYADSQGQREICPPLAQALAIYQAKATKVPALIR